MIGNELTRRIGTVRDNVMTYTDPNGELPWHVDGLLSDLQCRVSVPEGFVDAHLDTLAEAAFAGFHFDGDRATTFDSLSPIQQGNWRRAVRALFRVAEQLRVRP